MSGWISRPLGAVTHVVSGTTPRTDDQTAWGGSIVWITPADLGKLNARAFVDSERRITAGAVTKYSLELIPAGSVVMSSRAPIGHIAVAGVPFATNQGCKSFVPGPQVDGEFLYWLLRYRMDDIRSLGSGATFAEVSKSTLEGFMVRFPPLDEQRRIAAHLRDQLAEVDRARAGLEAQRAALDALPAALLREVFGPAR